MNRDIKFRFWNGVGRYFESSDRIAINKNGELISYDYETQEWDIYRVDKSIITIQQFTGLKDKNGREIYEGDIVKYKFQTGDDQNTDDILIKAVIFSDGKFNPIPEAFDCDDSWYSWKYYDFEVIGNTFENPELLKHD